MIIRFTKKISDHFTREEYYTGYHKGDGIIRIYSGSLKLALIMEMFRREIGGKPIVVSSWFRTKKMNERVGGISGSNHLKGEAMDFRISGEEISKANFIKNAKIFRSCCQYYGEIGEAGIYDGWYHFGLDRVQGRFFHWDSRSGKQINMPFDELK